jgi:hypothetical protein
MGGAYPKKEVVRFCPQDFPDRYHLCGREKEREDANGKWVQPEYGAYLIEPLHIVGESGKETLAAHVKRCSNCRQITAIAHSRDIPEHHRQSVETCLRQDYTRRELFRHEVLRGFLDVNLDPRKGEDYAQYQQRLKAYVADMAAR